MLSRIIHNWLRKQRLLNRESQRNRALGHLRRQVSEAGVWFVDIPRTGSTTIRCAMAQEKNGVFHKAYIREQCLKRKRLIKDHAPASEVLSLLGEDVWDRLFTFSIVKNPWDRMLSLYRYRVARGDIEPGFPFHSYLQLLERLDTRHPYSPFHCLPYYRSMTDALMDEEGQLLVDYIGRYEHMDETVKVIRDRSGMMFDLSQKYEVLGTGSDYRKAYDDKSAEIIARIYAEDVQRFGYSFD